MLVCCSVAANCQQSLSTKSNKAAELYREADNYRVRAQYIQAIQLLEEAIKKDKNFHEAHFRLALIYKVQGESAKAEAYLKSAEALNEGNKAGIYFELAELYMQQSDYEKAQAYADKFLALNPRNKRRLEEIGLIRQNAAFAIENQNASANFSPSPLPDIINSFAMQYFPILSVDGNTLIYTRRLGDSPADDEDIVISTKNADGTWRQPVSLSENINTRNNEGTCTLSADGRTLIFTSCLGRPGFGSCDLYISEKQGEEWSEPVNLGREVNSSAWDSQPSLSADGRTLYFISNRPGGIGNRDIWIASKDDKGRWMKPVNAGPLVNTIHDEVSPFIHPNNRILYYATNGLPGFGGFDIYYSEWDEGWQKPENIGAPINSGDDQVSLFIDSQGEKGYYSHEAIDKKQKGVLYEFDLGSLHTVKYKTSWVRGVVTDAVSKMPINAAIELIDLRDEQLKGRVTSDSVNGEYLMVLPEGTRYALYVDKPGYLFKSLSFDYSEQFEPIEVLVELQPLQAGSHMALNNIFFDLDKYELRPESHIELDRVAALMKSNSSLSIEISGHTDNQGDDAYNQQLSLRRAESVRNYLLHQQIAKDRMVVKGYGASNPIAENDTAKGRQINRRIKFKIVDF